MNFLSRLFSSRKTRYTIPPKPDWPETVRLMRDHSLGAFMDKAVQVVFSANGEHRFVLLESEKGYCYYLVEDLTPLDEEEWRFASQDPQALPAMWVPQNEIRRSLFGQREEAWQDFTRTEAYQRYFLTE